MQRNDSSNRLDDRAPDAREIDDDTLIGTRHPSFDDDDGDDDGNDEDRAYGVARHANPLPAREEEEQELSEADIMEELDSDDLKQMDGPDA